MSDRQSGGDAGGNPLQGYGCAPHPGGRVHPGPPPGL